MDLIAIADEKLAEIKARKAELIEEERTLRAQRDLLAGATKAPATVVPMRDETEAERDAMNAKIVATVKRGRKPKAERGGKTIGEKILDHIAECPNFGSSVEYIANSIGEEKRSVSYTLQNLKKAGKVERFGNGWRIPRDPAPAEEASDAGLEEEPTLRSDSEAEAFYGDDMPQAAE